MVGKESSVVVVWCALLPAAETTDFPTPGRRTKIFAKIEWKDINKAKTTGVKTRDSKIQTRRERDRREGSQCHLSERLVGPLRSRQHSLVGVLRRSSSRRERA